MICFPSASIFQLRSHVNALTLASSSKPEPSAATMLQHTMTKRKTLIIACFGIALGLCIGTVLKNYRALEIVKRCSLRPTNLKTPNEIIGLNDEDTIQNSQRNLVFVGVMTAKSFIEGRARAVYDTWGKEVPGRIAFFSSEGSYSEELPVVGLKNVDDRYPPQKKSFMMLYYMYEHYIDRFEWFIRADDDVYIEPDKLERFLRSIDSSKPQFIGQAGKGNSEEFGLLSLEFDENFCMGGPGVILSSETLRRVAPHIPTCLKNLYSTHEDVEVGRCVQKFAGIPCTWNYEVGIPTYFTCCHLYSFFFGFTDAVHLASQFEWTQRLHGQAKTQRDPQCHHAAPDQAGAAHVPPALVCAGTQG